MTGFRADETNQYPCFRIFVGKTYDSLNQIQQQTWKNVMIQNLGERGRMDSQWFRRALLAGSLKARQSLRMMFV